MSHAISDSFLPSGAVEPDRLPFIARQLSPSAMVSPMTRPSRSAVSSPAHHHTTLSPMGQLPLDRSLSLSLSGYRFTPPSIPPAVAADDIVEGYRKLAEQLREQRNGIRAHMAADQAHMEEVMNEERALWEQERSMLKARIAELEMQLAQASVGRNATMSGLAGRHSSSVQSPNSQIPSRSTVASGSSPSPLAQVPQESGRNSDGTPFYAPAPQNPSRTFEPSENNDLRVDSINVPSETPIIVTSKALTEADFGNGRLDYTRPSEGVSIDISKIQPELDGVPIKSTAVSASFAALVLSPAQLSSQSSSRGSHEATSPQTQHTAKDGRLSPVQEHARAIDIIAAPVHTRLTMHAGHTPSHSMSHLNLTDSGNATPTAADPQTLVESENDALAEPDPSRDVEILDEDPELTGPLTLNKSADEDAHFLEELTNKLNDAKSNGLLSPSQDSTSESEAGISLEQPDQEEPPKEDAEGPKLRMRPSLNFGMPFGVA